MLLSTRNIHFTLLLALSVSLSTAFGQSIIYVTPAGTGNKSGTSWLNALDGSTFKFRLTEASAGTQFWVAKGEYYTSHPTYVNNRSESFVIPSGVQVYGGFEGYETSLSEREITQPSNTTFTGEILNPNDRSDNAFHVVTFINASSSTRLDGVVVKRGSGQDGGGIYNNGSGAGNQSNPVIANCYITENQASYGGGINNYGYQGSTNPSIINCIIANNRAFVNGGGIYNNGFQGSCNPTITNCLSFSNVAADGGAYYNEAYAGVCNPVFRNCTIAENQSVRATFGVSTPYGSGAMYNDVPGGQGSCAPTLVNCLIWGNTAEFAPGSNTSIYNNGPITLTITYSTIQEGYAGTGNDSQNPNFLAGYRLSPNSPAIDTGDPTSTTGTVAATDLDGRVRVNNNRIDKGAYEYRLRYGNGYRLYVTPSGAGDFSGSSWGNALSANQVPVVLVDALSGTEFWLAAGTYKPTTTTNRLKSFIINSGVRVYGGFAGTETTLGQRNIEANPTVFSGDIGSQNNRTDNVFHVINLSQASDTPFISGLTVSGGNANGAYPLENGNTGGGIYIGRSNPVIEQCVIELNNADSGGGVYINSNTSSPNPTVRLNKCIIRNNSASSGGGINVYTYAFRSLVATACSFISNTATSGGGGVYNGSSVEFANCLFQSNSASNGGAFTCGTIQGTLTNVFRNCTIVGNSASNTGGGIYASQGFGSSTTTLLNTIMRNNTAPASPSLFFDGGIKTVTYSNIQGGYTGTGNIDADPLFVDAANGNYRLQLGSPSINTGDPASTTANVSATDLAGNNRVEGGRIDMGAYERQTVTGPLVTVKEGLWNDPFTWQYQQLPVSGDTILIRHRVGVPASYVGQARTVQYDVNGQLVFSPDARLTLGGN